MKIARGRELLTSDQRKLLMEIPEDEMIGGTYYTFSNQDLEIINKRRREENRLGFAMQLAVLRYPGWSYTHVKDIPESVKQYIAKQVNADPSSLILYPQRENTLWDHLKEIRSEYDFVTFTLKEYRMTFKHLHQLALENGDAIHLLNESIEFLRKNKVILPAITTDASASANGSFANKIEPIQISGNGSYTVELQLSDGIQRTSKKTVTVNVKANTQTVCEPSLRVDPPVQSIKVGETASYRAIYTDENCDEHDVTDEVDADWSVEDPSIGEHIK